MTRKGWLPFAAISLFWGIPYLLSICRVFVAFT